VPGLSADIAAAHQLGGCLLGLLGYTAAAVGLWSRAAARLRRDLDLPAARGSDRRPFEVVPLKVARSPSGRG
jgi:hypothetical protein